MTTQKSVLAEENSGLKIGQKEKLLVSEMMSLEDTKQKLDGQIIRDLEITGNTVFSTEEFLKILAPYIGKRIDPIILSYLGKLITNRYALNGYIASFATVPVIGTRDGIVKIEITEGNWTLDKNKKC